MSDKNPQIKKKKKKSHLTLSSTSILFRPSILFHVELEIPDRKNHSISAINTTKSVLVVPTSDTSVYKSGTTGIDKMVDEKS